MKYAVMSGSYQQVKNSSSLISFVILTGKRSCRRVQFQKTFLCSTAWKSSKWGVFSGPYFPVFGLNTEMCGVNHRIQSEWRKKGPEKTPYLETFHSVFISFTKWLVFTSKTSSPIFQMTSGYCRNLEYLDLCGICDCVEKVDGNMPYFCDCRKSKNDICYFRNCGTFSGSS